MFKLFEKTISKTDIEETLDIIEAELTDSVIPTLTNIAKTLKGFENRKRFTSLMIFKDIKTKDDLEFISDLISILKRYKAAIPALRAKIKDLPEELPLRTNNPNLRTIYMLYNTGIFMITDLPLILVYLLDRFYINDSNSYSSSVLDEMFKDVTKQIRGLVELYKFYIKTDIEDVINTVGKMPAGKNLVSTMVLKVLRSLGFTDNKTLGFINKSINEGYSLGFTGNPIYHIRKFLVDLQINRLKSLEERKKLLELKLLELKQRLKNEPENEKLKKQIEYYEKQLALTEEKIRSIIED